MRIGMWLSNWGGSPLYAGLWRGLEQLGHAVEFHRRAGLYDLVLMFNQSAHRQDYVYPDFPLEGVPVAFVDCAEYGYWTRLPGQAARFANLAAAGALAHDTKNRMEQERLIGWLQGQAYPYFLREMSVNVDYPAGYYPIDYPLYHLSDESRLPDREDYLRRDLELFCSWGASHPWRLPITAALRGAHRKAEIGVLETDWPRLPQAHYFERMRAARCTVSFDGYGSGSFRRTEALVRTVLLDGPLSIRERAALQDGVTCVQYTVTGDGEHFVSTDIADRLAGLLDDPERAWLIYRQGYEFCRTELSETAWARYVLQTLEAHDWRRTTPLRLKGIESNG